jgi:hypothetical protein
MTPLYNLRRNLQDSSSQDGSKENIVFYATCGVIGFAFLIGWVGVCFALRKRGCYSRTVQPVTSEQLMGHAQPDEASIPNNVPRLGNV